LRQKLPWAKKVDHFHRNPEDFFTTILIAENIALVVTTTFFTRFIIKTYGPIGTFYSVIIISIISLIFAQIIPKAIGLRKNTTYISRTINPIYTLSIFLKPVINIISKVINIFLKLYPKEEFTHLLAHEIIEGFRDVRSYGYLSQKADRIAERLNLIRKTSLSEIMIPLEKAVVVHNPDEVTRFDGNQIYSRIPVIEGEKIRGVINVKEYIYTDRIEIRPPLIVNIDTPLLSLLRIMKESGEQMAIVVFDEKPIGIVTLEDLIEEMIGEIEEEI